MAIVEFTDFHCPFCKSVQPTLGQFRSCYGEKVKLVHRDFPIDQLHPNARKAHKAARCANEQGKFWTYHAALYANAPKAGSEQLKAYAREGASTARPSSNASPATDIRRRCRRTWKRAPTSG